MKSLKDVILESLNSKGLFDKFDIDADDDLDAYEILWILVNETEKGTALWDDSMSFNPKETWDYWQSTNGTGDDALVDELDIQFKNCAIVGWMSKESFDDCKKQMPKETLEFLEDFTKNNKPKDKLHARNVDMTLWKAFDKKTMTTLKIAQFKKYVNDHGTDYPEWWIVIGME